PKVRVEIRTDRDALHQIACRKEATAYKALMADFKVIFTSAIPLITEVRLYEETIEKVRKGHPEVPILLPSISNAVDGAIANPTGYFPSYNNSYVYLDEETTNASGDALHVPCQLIKGTTSARVRSIYFAEVDASKIRRRKS